MSFGAKKIFFYLLTHSIMCGDDDDGSVDGDKKIHG